LPLLQPHPLRTSKKTLIPALKPHNPLDGLWFLEPANDAYLAIGKVAARKGPRMDKVYYALPMQVGREVETFVGLELAKVVRCNKGPPPTAVHSGGRVLEAVSCRMHDCHEGVERTVGAILPVGLPWGVVKNSESVDPEFGYGGAPEAVAVLAGDGPRSGRRDNNVTHLDVLKRHEDVGVNAGAGSRSFASTASVSYGAVKGQSPAGGGWRRSHAGGRHGDVGNVGSGDSSDSVGSDGVGSVGVGVGVGVGIGIGKVEFEI
jgi:hypothetical protein